MIYRNSDYSSSVAHCCQDRRADGFDIGMWTNGFEGDHASNSRSPLFSFSYGCHECTFPICWGFQPLTHYVSFLVVSKRLPKCREVLQDRRSESRRGSYGNRMCSFEDDHASNSCATNSSSLVILWLSSLYHLHFPGLPPPLTTSLFS